MDFIAKGLNSIFGSTKSRPRESAKRSLLDRNATRAAAVQETATAASNIAAGDLTNTDLDSATADLETKMQSFQQSSYSVGKVVGTEAQNQAKTFLGGLSPSEYLKAWKGYVAQRSDAVNRGKATPASKQTFLTGGL